MTGLTSIRPASATKLLTGLVVALVAIVSVSMHAKATEIQRVVSPNGIEAWLVEDHTLPLITMKIAFRGGAAQDPDEKSGLAKFTAATIDEGSGDLDSQAFQARLQDLAIRLNFDAGRDTFEGNLKTLTEHSDEAFRLFGQALNNPRFDEEPVERMRAQILNAIRASQQNPQHIAGRAWINTALPGHAYARDTDGTTETVSAIAADDLRDYAERVFARDNLMIAVVGDIDAERLAEVVDQIFGDLPKSPQLTPVEQAPAMAGPVRRIIEMDIPQAIVQFGHQGLAREDPDFIPAFIVNHILGGGSFSSRLYSEVREKRGLAYSVYTYLHPLDNAAFFAGGVATQNERVAEAIETIEAEIRRMAEDGPTDEELANAKSYLTGSYALRFDTGSKIASQLIGIQEANLGIDYINERNGMIEAVTIDDVRRVAKRLLDADSLITTIVGKPVGVSEVNVDG